MCGCFKHPYCRGKAVVSGVLLMQGFALAQAPQVHIQSTQSPPQHLSTVRNSASQRYEINQTFDGGVKDPRSPAQAGITVIDNGNSATDTAVHKG